MEITINKTAENRADELFSAKIVLTDRILSDINAISTNLTCETKFTLAYAGKSFIVKKTDTEKAEIMSIVEKTSQIVSDYELLYKRDTKGKVRVWMMQQEGDKYRTVSGIDGGSMVASKWKIATPKNVGKSNETTAEMQAVMEINSAYKKKREQSGYGLSVADSGTKYTEPMLAKKYSSGKVSYELGYYQQPKLDGVRCIATVNPDGSVELKTRKGKDIVSCPHIAESIQKLKFPEGTRLDGELYNHEYYDRFQELVSIIRKQKVDTEKLQVSNATIQFHIYDIVSEEQFYLRHSNLKTMMAGNENYCLKLVETRNARSEEDSDKNHADWIEQGYEGSIYRHPIIGYEHKRSNSLMKRKEFDDDEFVILDVLEGEGNRAEMAGKMVFKNSDGAEFKASIRGNNHLFKIMLNRKDLYIGREATVRYMGFTDAGLPRHGVVVDIHKEKRKD